MSNNMGGGSGGGSSAVSKGGATKALSNPLTTGDVRSIINDAEYERRGIRFNDSVTTVAGQLDSMVDDSAIYIGSYDRKTGEVSDYHEFHKQGGEWYDGKKKVSPVEMATILGRETGTQLYRISDNKPIDTSTHFKVTGKKTETIGGLKYKDATYDTLVMERGVIGKKEQQGQYTIFNGHKYGVHQNSQGYVISHLGTGRKLASGIETMEKVAETIKTADKKIDWSKVPDVEKRYKNVRRMPNFK